MTELMRALTALFARAGLPVYLRGWVPADVPRPLVVLTVEAPPPLGQGSVTAECRFGGGAEGRSANALRLEAMDALAALVPPGGCLLRWGGGAALLRPAQALFRELTDEPGHGGDTAGRLRFTLWAV